MDGYIELFHFQLVLRKVHFFNKEFFKIRALINFSLDNVFNISYASGSIYRQSQSLIDCTEI